MVSSPLRMLPDGLRMLSDLAVTMPICVRMSPNSPFVAPKFRSAAVTVTTAQRVVR